MSTLCLFSFNFLSLFISLWISFKYIYFANGSSHNFLPSWYSFSFAKRIIYCLIACNCVIFFSLFFSTFFLLLYTVPSVWTRHAATSVSSCWNKAPLQPAWNNSYTSLFPTCKYPLPVCVIWQASMLWSISMLSSLSCTLRQIRNLELLHILSSTTPPGFWVASSKWIPKLLPTWATLINSCINSGSAFFNSANSSIIISKWGIGSLTLPELNNLV